MEKSNKNTKWIILGSIVFIVAILLAVAPGLFMKYMRTKWESNRHYQTSPLLINVSGELKKSNDNNYYIKGNNGLFYVLEKIEQNVIDNLGKNCSVVGEFREAKNNETVDGNPVRLFIGIKKLTFEDDNININVNDKDSESLSNNIDIDKTGEEIVSIKEKSLKKAKLRVEANTVLNKPILFNVIKGRVVAFNRKDLKGADYTALVLVDEFGDNYMLYKKGKNLSSLENKEIICLGREIIPPNNFPLVVDETTFEIYEVYDYQYNKLM